MILDLQKDIVVFHNLEKYQLNRHFPKTAM